MRLINFTYTLDITYKGGVDYRVCNKERKAGKDVSSFFFPKETGIYMSWSIGGKYYKQAMGDRIRPVEWDFNLNLPSKKYSKNRDLTARLSNKMAKILKHYSNMRLNELLITPDTVKDMVCIAINGNVEVTEEDLFWAAYKEFYIEKAQLCRSSTAKKYKSLETLLKTFETVRYPLNFDLISKRWHTDFRLYCIGLGYLNNTTNKYIKMVKGFMNWSCEMKYHNNMDFKRFKLEFETTEPISLTIEELKSIEEFDPGKNRYMDIAQDIFLVGVYSAQRVSDLMAMKKKDIKIQADGEIWWDVHQIKGRKLVRVYMVSKAREILDKYLTGKKADDFVFPRQSTVVTNRSLKKIGKAAGIDAIISKINYSGQTKKEVTEPKYFFLSMHTARKTAVSLMCFNNMPDHLIQNISGHASNKEMLVYKSIDRLKIRDGLTSLFEPKDISKSA